MNEIHEKSMLVRVSAKFELTRVRVIQIRLFVGWGRKHDLLFMLFIFFHAVQENRVSLELNLKTLVLAQIREGNFSTTTKQSINLAISKRHNKIKLAAAKL